MTSFDTVRVAAIQATPVILDVEGTIEKAERLLHEAADAGARLAVLPQCFVALYPPGPWAGAARPGARGGGPPPRRAPRVLRVAVPLGVVGRGDEPVERSVRRAVGAPVDEQRRRARTDARPPRHRLPRARPPRRDRGQRTR